METKIKIKEIVQNEYAREAGIIALHEKLRAALVPFEGKPVSKRLATAVQKALGDKWIVDIDKSVPMLTYIHCIPYDAQNRYKPYKWEDRARFSLSASGVFHFDDRPNRIMTGIGFDTLNRGTGGVLSKAWQRRRKALLSDDKKLESLAILIDSHIKITSALKGTLEEWDGDEPVIPDSCEIKKLYKGANNMKIKLGGQSVTESHNELVAAAPELLEALISTTRLLRYTGKADTWQVQQAERVLAKLKKGELK